MSLHTNLQWQWWQSFVFGSVGVKSKIYIRIWKAKKYHRNKKYEETEERKENEADWLAASETRQAC